MDKQTVWHIEQWVVYESYLSTKRSSWKKLTILSLAKAFPSSFAVNVW